MTYSTYGQVEPNHLSGQATKEIYAQLPAEIDVQNGMFLCYNQAEGKITVPSATSMEPMLAFSEVKVYGARETEADFYIPANSDVYPRFIKTKVGDTITTNVVSKTGAAGAIVVADTDDLPAAKDVLVVAANGTLVPEGDALAVYTAMQWTVVKVYTMPDGTPGIKIQRTL